MKRRVTYLFFLVSIGYLVPVVTASDPVHGAIEKVGDVRILRVYGAPQEMGRAHGYLLADEIVATVESNAKFFFRETQHYEAALQLTAASIDIPESSKLEIAAILVGITERKGQTPRVEFLGRQLQLEDLILGNAMDTLRAFACSGFTVWGEKAGDAGVITARNFDFALTESPERLAPGFILVRAPVGKRQVASVAEPGYIGVYTGVNEDGVCAFLHDGTGQRFSKPQKRYIPLALALKDFLENTAPADALTSAEASLKSIVPYPFSYLVRIVAPRVPGSEAAPLRVFHVDADGLGENPSNTSPCVTTNHYIDAGQVPARNAGSNSVLRYKRLAERTDSLIDSKAAWEALKLVAVRSSRADATLHSIVVLPEKKVLEIAFATPGKVGVKPAPDHAPLSLPFEKLFARQQP